MTNNGVSIHWFRKGLRLHDNPALLRAIDLAIDEFGGNHYQVRPIFILDPDIKKHLQVGNNRWRFLVQSLKDLHNSLLSIGSRLFVLRGKPEEIFTKIFVEWNVKCLTFESDIEPYACKRDQKVEKLAKNAGVKVITEVSHTIYHPELILKHNLGKPPLTYQKFLSVAEDIGNPEEPKEPPKHLPDYCQCITVDDGDDKYSVPTLSELGIDENTLEECKFPGGETVALERLEHFMKKKAWVCKFEKPSTSPNSLEPSTTVLSPYLKFGCLSARKFYSEVKKVVKGSVHSKPPVSLIGQLMWREFYYTVGSATPNYDKMKGNPICCQVPWRENKQHLEAWKFGRTGYPFIDAIMTQLRKEGWIHHLARHAVACFLTRGDLWISWEEGQKVFEEFLLDADWALNAGNWMWLSASAFFHQFHRVYSPVQFGKKTDKFGDYIKKYIPQLRKMPPEYIYEPWKAPLSVQKSAGCIVGQDYPDRIVIHEDVYKTNITKLSQAYKDWKGSKDNSGENSQNSQKKTSKAKKLKTK